MYHSKTFLTENFLKFWLKDSQNVIWYKAKGVRTIKHRDHHLRILRVPHKEINIISAQNTLCLLRVKHLHKKTLQQGHTQKSVPPHELWLFRRLHPLTHHKKQAKPSLSCYLHRAHFWSQPWKKSSKRLLRLKTCDISVCTQASLLKNRITLLIVCGV